MIAAQKVKKLAPVLRLACQQVARSRGASAAASGFRAAARSFAASLHQLWLEVTGFTFLAIAAAGTVAGFHEYGKYQAGHESSPGRMILVVCFTLAFAWFGLTSFLRAGKKPRS